MKARAAGDYVMATGQMNFDVVLDHGRGPMQAKVTGTPTAPSIRVAPSLLRQVEPDRVERNLEDVLRKFR
jgi:hypothetical protein